MKKHFIFFAILMIVVVSLFAQAPQKFSYQAVLRDAGNNIVTNHAVGVRISILQGGMNGSVVYMETQTAVTNTNGLMTIQIGGGSVQSGDMAAIDWANGPFFIKTEVDPNGSANYTIEGTQQLLSVPYALYAGNTTGGFSGDYNDLINTPTIPTVPTNVSFFTNDAHYVTEAQLNALLVVLNNTIDSLRDRIEELEGNSAHTGDTIVDGQACIGMPTVTDYDGNVYNTVQIGNQCWMKENLRTTKYADGTAIASGSSTSTTEAYYYSTSGDLNFGKLYNWKAVMRNSSSSAANPSGVQGICPDGWHVPSRAELYELTGYLGWGSQYYCSNNSEYIAKALASTTNWSSSSNTCAVGNTPSDNNATGFSALPAGIYHSNGYDYFGDEAHFWCATEANSTFVYFFYLSYNSSYVGYNVESKDIGKSVRCVRNNSGTSTLPTVTTVEVAAITDTTAIIVGNVTDAGNSVVTARGVCWGTMQNPSVSDNHTTDGGGIGNFTSSLTGLSANTTYYVRAYAMNSVGISYGNELSFTTVLAGNNDGQPCVGATTITDYDGNVYNTVQIGNQCWMKENLRTTKYADGTAIASGSSTSTTEAYYYSTSGDLNFGKLYNWKAIMRNSSSSAANPSGVQGICPDGWHVPSRAELYELTGYLGWESQYYCSNNSEYIAKALASTTNWSSSSNTCAVGNTPSDNNATGFSALPAGIYYSNGYDYFGNEAHFWCTTEANSTFVYFFYLSYNSSYVGYNVESKDIGQSVRCLRD